MDEIVVSVKRVTDIMAEISAASGEQERGIEQINQAIGGLDGMTQQNAALVEQAAAAALQGQSGRLAEVAAIFKLGSGAPAAGAAPDVRPPPATPSLLASDPVRAA